MSEDRSDEQTHERFERVFTLRLWRENDGDSATMRGSILEIRSGQRFYFTELGDLKDFLTLRLSAGRPDNDR